MEDFKKSCISSWILEIFSFCVAKYLLKFYVNCHSATRENVCVCGVDVAHVCVMYVNLIILSKSLKFTLIELYYTSLLPRSRARGAQLNISKCYSCTYLKPD